MTATVNTVTGSIIPDQLGTTLMHEHIMFGFPGFQGDVTRGPFDREAVLARCVDQARLIITGGVRTLVDATPNDCGRDPLFLRELSERSGLQIVCSTGYYYEGEGATPYFKFRSAIGDIEQEIYELMLAEVTEGIGTTGIKAGVIKLASSKDTITPYEQAFFRAGARVQRETGVPIITHTQEGTMAPQQAELLIGAGADPTKIMIGHMDGNTDVEYHLRTLAHGVSIAMDRWGVQVVVGMPMDEQRMAVLRELLRQGHADRIMLSHDSIWHWLGRPFAWPEPLQQMLANWHPLHVIQDVLPALQHEGFDDVERMITDNPRRLFGGQ